VLPDGTVKYLHTIRHPVLNSAGEIVRLVGTTVDITERKRAEESLRQSENYLAEAQRLSHTGSFAFDVASNKYVYISEECFRIFELDPQHSLPSREAVSRLIHQDDWSRAQADFDRLLRDKVDTPSEFRIVLPSGAVKHIQVIRHPVLNEAREVVTIVGTAMDITGRKRADEALRLANAYNRGLIEASLDPLVTIGHDGKITDVNAATESATDRSRGELIGTDFCDYFTEPSNARAGYEQVFREGLVRDYPLELRHRNGHVMSVSYNAAVYRNESGEVVGVFAAARDITQRKRAEEALRESEATLNRAQSVAHIGSWYLDLARNRLTWSDEVFRIFGVPLRTALTYGAFLEMVHPDDRESVDKAWSAALHGAPYDIEHRIIVGGDVKWVREQAQLEFSKEGDATSGIGTVQDITERKRAEEDLRRSEAYLSEAQRLTQTGSWALSVITGEYSYWSEQMFRIFAIDPQSGLPKIEQVVKGIDSEDRDRIRQAIRTSFLEKDNDFEFKFVPPDGKTKHIHCLTHPVLDPKGEVVEVVGTVLDITERKRAEEALRESEMRFRTFVDHAADALCVLDEQRRIIDTNREACQSSGYSREELIGKVPQDFDPDVDAAMLQRIDDQIAAGEISTFETRNRRKDGTLFPVEVRVRGFQHGGRRLHLALARDISERKRAEEALRESETRFRTFVDHAGDALFVFDLEQGTIIDVNRSACEELGYTREELIGNTPAALHLDSDRAEVEASQEQAAAGETVIERHLHRRKDGSTFPVEVHTSLLSHEGRRFLLNVARDITDRVQAEEQRDKLRQLEAELAHLDRLTILGELTASIAHEVNQPLAGVVSNGSACLRWLAGETPNLEEAREAARRIVRDGKRAAEVVARVRAMTKRTEASREKLDLNETIREVLALVGEEAKKNRVLIRTEFADDVLLVFGDRVQLQQVVLNLVMNGIEAMRDVGENARQLAIATRTVEPNQVQVTVEDSGIGVDPDRMPRIFDPFYTTKPSGMGMGLSISRSILQAHAGQLWAAANDGPGTSFHFTLPKCQEEAHEKEENAGFARV
jgi:PAS domain S-box-containing protein